MLAPLDDTIAALASAPGPGVRGIVRLSGPRTLEVVSCVFQSDADDWKRARRAGALPGLLRLHRLSIPVPCTLFLWPNRNSYTGQPAAELHLPGSPPLLEAALETLATAGARPARPGEFTLRAFLAGRIDLVQAEAVLGVVDAHDERELETALSQLAGGVSRRIARLRSDLLDLLADLEAGLDFVEEDIEFVSPEALAARLDEAARFLSDLAEQAADRMTMSVRRRVVLGGLPNAGKSTLFNALVGRDAALVSEAEGTTRDWLWADWSCRGVPVELIDTAGWQPDERAGRNVGIDALAQLLRREKWNEADLIVWCSASDLDEESRIRDAALREAERQRGRPILVALTKCDAHDRSADNDGVQVAAPAGIGIDLLSIAIVERLTGERPGERQFLGTTAARCRESLGTAAEALGRARAAAVRGLGDELVAIELRAALDPLGQIVGAVCTDDVLDRLFSRFCIGK